MHFSLVISLSAFLLFLVEPIIAKEILPWFGGAASVWTTCMVFFQFALLAGYAYSDWVVHRLTPRAQAATHTALLLVSLAVLPIIPGASWKPAGDEQPVLRILGLLATTIGPPFVMLSTTGPLVQAWLARVKGRDPYRLFALSNAASLLALIGYPVLLEPWLATRTQALVWSGLYAAFALLCISLAWRAARAPAAQAAAVEVAPEMVAGAQPRPPTLGRRLLWLSLAATGSVLLLAVTNHMTQDIASVPLLWLLPLTIYLFSFILCFDAPRWYRRPLFHVLGLFALGGLAWLLVESHFRYNLLLQLGAFSGGLFVLCMFCHGELARTKPAPRYLTGFYLMVAAGGALGAILVGVVAPMVLAGYYEMGLALVACALLAVVVVMGESHWRAALAAIAVIGAAGATYANVREEVEDTHVRTRNFYGVLRVKDVGRPNEPPTLRRLIHGTILHGEQGLTPEQRKIPTTYYTETSGIGVALSVKQATGPIRLGVIGLGAGTLAAYGREHDSIRFYDINPAVIDIAKHEFTFLSDSKATIDIVLGDARLNLEREEPQQFDVLAVDAFSGDAIPVHLLTREALGVYLRHMKPDGIIAFHISNRFLNLAPVIQGLADERDLAATIIEETEHNNIKRVSDWILVTRQQEVMNASQIADLPSAEQTERRPFVVWTDDYNNLLQVLN